jgi:hypothetical protein
MRIVRIKKDRNISYSFPIFPVAKTVPLIVVLYNVDCKTELIGSNESLV